MINESIRLNECGPDEIGDVLLKVERSFGIKFAPNELDKVQTFGDLCDAIQARMVQEHCDGCTKQQAFYKIRQAIAQTRNLDKNSIIPTTALETLFPKKGRRKNIQLISKYLRVPIKILRQKEWVNNILLLCILGSVIEIFINWKYGLAALALTIILFRIVTLLGKEFTIRTVGELADTMARENYIQSRRDPNTINRSEIARTIQSLFSHELLIDPSDLSRDASLGWSPTPVPAS